MAAELKEYYNDTDLIDGVEWIDNTHWAAQTFKVSDDYTITSVKLVLNWYSSIPSGNVVVSIKNTESFAGGTRPVGSDLCSASIPCTALPQHPEKTWTEIIFEDPCSLVKDETYAIVVHTEVSSPDIVWRNDGSSPTYSDGNYSYSINSGSYWTISLDIDFMFEVYGDSEEYSLKQHYDNSDTYFQIYTSGVEYQAGQSFTPATTHIVLKVSLKLFRSGSTGTPGVFNVKIYNTDGNGHPTGVALVSGTSDADSLTTDTNGQWRDIYFGDGVELTEGVLYVIVVDAPDASVNSVLNWRYDNADSSYDGGIRILSSNGGSSWADDAEDDHAFREYGPSSVPPEITDQSGNIIVSLDQLVNLFVTATGTPSPEYQWYQNGVPISGEINSTLSFYAQSVGSSTYKCKVSNIAGTVWSNDMTVIVVSNPYIYHLFNLNTDANRES